VEETGTSLVVVIAKQGFCCNGALSTVSRLLKVHFKDQKASVFGKKMLYTASLEPNRLGFEMPAFLVTNLRNSGNGFHVSASAFGTYIKG
jgi:hypothetical protein